jgi:putative ABC transport system ATP-binding protein
MLWLSFLITASHNCVQAVLHHSSLSRVERMDRARSLLTELGLGQRLHHLPIELSVGQQQLVAVARALIHSPAIVFADEPCGDVDPETGKEIIDYLIRCVKKQNCTLIVATHGPFPLHVADNVLHLVSGELLDSERDETRTDKNMHKLSAAPKRIGI